MDTRQLRKFRTKLFTTIIITLTILASFSQFALVKAQSDSETPLIVSSLNQKDLIWTVEDSMGIFAEDGYHPLDRIKFEVFSTDGVNKKYIVNASDSSWITYPEQNWEVDESVTESDYKLIPRDWYSAARDIYSVEDSEYWLTIAELRSTYTIDYSDVFIGGKLINIVTIEIRINDTNYDVATYTRAEGILLSRHTVVETTDDEGDPLTGEFLITLTSFSGDFAVSFWHYVVWFAIIFVGVLVLVAILSFVLAKRQKSIPDY